MPHYRKPVNKQLLPGYLTLKWVSLTRVSRRSRVKSDEKSTVVFFWFSVNLSSISCYYLMSKWTANVCFAEVPAEVAMVGGIGTWERTGQSLCIEWVLNGRAMLRGCVRSPWTSRVRSLGPLVGYDWLARSHILMLSNLATWIEVLVWGDQTKTIIWVV